MPLVTWILPALGTLLAAWAVQNSRGSSGGVNVGSMLDVPSNPTVTPDPPAAATTEHHHEHAIYVIGDLHGDGECAEHWVKRTGLMDYHDEQDSVTNDNSDSGDEKTGRRPSTWKDPTSHLLFVGDYVDKGPTSRQVIELVKDLTERFPSHVTALLGNHEMELLLDRDRDRWDSWGGAGFFGLSYASAHPAEYLNYLDRDVTAEDEVVVTALYAASVEVYGRGLHSDTYMAPRSLVGIQKSIVRFVPAHLRLIVEERLREYQETYLNAFRSGTALGTWLENRPILAQWNETLFVHGGISQHGTALIDHLGVEGINSIFREHSGDETVGAFVEGTREGQIIYDLLTFRGNHQDGACEDLPRLLPRGVSRLGVGHTPGSAVRVGCSDTFLALDSSLGRWFRNSGNEYCPGLTKVISSDGRYVCEAINKQCEGQIVRLTAGGGVERIE